MIPNAEEASDKFNRTVLSHHVCGKSLKKIFNISPELPWDDNQRQVVKCRVAPVI